jgi:hypothetical protein
VLAVLRHSLGDVARDTSRNNVSSNLPGQIVERRVKGTAGMDDSGVEHGSDLKPPMAQRELASWLTPAREMARRVSASR